MQDRSAAKLQQIKHSRLLREPLLARAIKHDTMQWDVIDLRRCLFLRARANSMVFTATAIGVARLLVLGCVIAFVAICSGSGCSGMPVLQQPFWLPNDDTVIKQVNVAEIASGSGATIANGVATKKLSAGELTWFSNHTALPAPQMLACATVYVKLHSDFIPGDGGKLPGLDNTGQHRQNASNPEIINGKSYPNTGWGGRSPDGVHWSARTGFGRWTDTHVATHSYFYAMRAP